MIDEIPAAVWLLALVVGLYLLFSKVGRTEP